jgi:hypothetical protein
MWQGAVSWWVAYVCVGTDSREERRSFSVLPTIAQFVTEHHGVFPYIEPPGQEQDVPAVVVSVDNGKLARANGSRPIGSRRRKTGRIERNAASPGQQKALRANGGPVCLAVGSPLQT